MSHNSLSPTVTLFMNKFKIKLKIVLIKGLSLRPPWTLNLYLGQLQWLKHFQIWKLYTVNFSSETCLGVIWVVLKPYVHILVA